MEGREMIRLITIGRAGITQEMKDKLRLQLDLDKQHLISTHGFRISADFDKFIIYTLKEDKRIKNWKWYHARRHSIKIPLEKELQVFYALEDHINKFPIIKKHD